MFNFLGKREAGTAQLQQNTYSFYFMQLQLSSFTITIFFVTGNDKSVRPMILIFLWTLASIIWYTFIIIKPPCGVKAEKRTELLTSWCFSSKYSCHREGKNTYL